MIVVHELPFLFTEYELFNLLMRTATPYYQKISRAAVRKDYFSAYDIEKKKVKDLLKHVDKVSVTIDLCKSAEWKIEDKVWTVYVDNVAYNDAAIRMLKDNLAYKNSLTLNAHEKVGYMQAMVSKMKKKIDKYWGDCNLLISIAVISDPRNKMKLVKWCFLEIYSKSDAIEQMTIVQETLLILYNEYVKAHRAKNVDIETSGAKNQKEGSNYNVRGKGKVRGRAQFYGYIKNVDNIIEQAKSKLNVYLEDGVHICEDDEKFDALEWWKMNNTKYRILSKMARDILSIPIATVASESAFSARGRVIDPHRVALGAGIVQVLTCGSYWLRAFYGIQRKRKANTIIYYTSVFNKTW
ncbi:hypothetical protein GH714_009903 [Hevea brasiliensis]|uniref:HAT C-terminal dimerisation domain-containing protein n=1 Tax=Hevea brasiliensis TaxID=3981 RepID=A0A6A6NGD8_HEVBR|nr:hypothetical protein GH714_009903 [Hevea brasiliensis]